MLGEAGVKNVAVYDVSSTQVSYLIAEAWRCSHLVLAAPTYNMNLYPPMEAFVRDMKALNLQNRTVAILENGSWACCSGKHLRAMVEELKQTTLLENSLSLASSMKEEQLPALEKLRDEIVASLAQD